MSQQLATPTGFITDGVVTVFLVQGMENEDLKFHIFLSKVLQSSHVLCK